MKATKVRGRVDELLMSAFGISRELAQHVALRGECLLNGEPIFRYGWETIAVPTGARFTEARTGCTAVLVGEAVRS